MEPGRVLCHEMFLNDFTSWPWDLSQMYACQYGETTEHFVGMAKYLPAFRPFGGKHHHMMVTGVDGIEDILFWHVAHLRVDLLGQTGQLYKARQSKFESRLLVFGSLSLRSERWVESLKHKRIETDGVNPGGAIPRDIPANSEEFQTRGDGGKPAGNSR